MKNSDEYKALKFATMLIILGTGLFFIIPLRFDSEFLITLLSLLIYV